MCHCNSVFNIAPAAVEVNHKWQQPRLQVELKLAVICVAAVEVADDQFWCVVACNGSVFCVYTTRAVLHVRHMQSGSCAHCVALWLYMW